MSPFTKKGSGTGSVRVRAQRLFCACCNLLPENTIVQSKTLPQLATPGSQRMRVNKLVFSIMVNTLN